MLEFYHLWAKRGRESEKCVCCVCSFFYQLTIQLTLSSQLSGYVERFYGLSTHSVSLLLLSSLNFTRWALSVSVCYEHESLKIWDLIGGFMSQRKQSESEKVGGAAMGVKEKRESWSINCINSPKNSNSVQANTESEREKEELEKTFAEIWDFCVISQSYNAASQLPTMWAYSKIKPKKNQQAREKVSQWD